MKSLVLYGSQRKLTNAHKLVTSPKQPKYFVRIEVCDMYYSDALEQSLPKPGEVVLNSIPINIVNRRD